LCLYALFFPVIDILILIQTMTTFPSFNDHYRPQLQRHLDRDVVDFMETKVKEAQRINDADEAERLLDQACDQCVQNVKVQMDEIKASVRQKGTTCTSSEDRQKYTLFVEEVTAGIRSTQELFDEIFERIREIVKPVIDRIKQGLP
jgi:hypothetical protein